MEQARKTIQDLRDQIQKEKALRIHGRDMKSIGDLGSWVVNQWNFILDYPFPLEYF